MAPMRADAASVGGKDAGLGAAAAGAAAAGAAEVEEAPKAAAKVSVRTPQIHWHGKSPVFTVDFHPLIPSLCATGGNEPDGSGGVKLWIVNPAEGGAVSAVSYVQDLVGHEKTVNTLRFSPSGDMLASAGVEGVIVLWRRTAAASTAEEALEGKEKWEYQTMLRAHTLDVCDIAWSHCSQFIASASVDNTASVFSVNRQEKVLSRLSFFPATPLQRTGPCPPRTSALEATQGQIDGCISQLPYNCHQNRVASVGD